MKRHIPLVLMLAVVLCLSGCTDRHDLPTVPPTSAMEAPPQAAEREKSTEMTTEKTTMPEIDTTEPMLLLTIDGTAVDVQWENNAAVNVICSEGVILLNGVLLFINLYSISTLWHEHTLG